MSEFKVGDWVRHKYVKTVHRCTYVNGGEFEDKISTKPSLSFDSEYMEDYILWKPKVGEWCWFWKGYPSSEVPQLQQFKELEKLGRYTTMQKGCFNHCEPCIGELPTFLKEL